MPYNNNNLYQVNTTGFTYWNENMQFKLDFLNQSVIMYITPATIDANTGKKTYIRKTNSSGTLTIERAVALSQLINDEFIPAIHDHVEYLERRIVQNQLNNAIVGLILKEEYDPNLDRKVQNIYLEINSNLQDHVSSNVITYKFGKSTGILESYDPKTGDFKVYEKEIQAQFIMFASALNEYVHCYSGAVMHTMRLRGMYRVQQTIEDIARKLGIERRRPQARRDTAFDPNAAVPAVQNNDQDMTYTPQEMSRPEPPKVTTLTSIDDLIGGDNPF